VTASVAERTADNRRLLADFFDSLTEDELETRSLCAEWTVREVLAHLAMPLVMSLPRFALEIARSRGSLDRASVAVARGLARRDVHELTGILRAHADKKVPAPGVGPMGQMADGCIHLRDCARPLRLPADVTLSDWRMVLDYLPTKQAGRGLVPEGRLDGLRFRASDQEWTLGTGPEVIGSSEALALSLTGRSAALVDLTGPGADALARRLAR
jgi:uncharacterized protein (TIGR03083 family)